MEGARVPGCELFHTPDHHSSQSLDISSHTAERDALTAPDHCSAHQIAPLPRSLRSTIDGAIAVLEPLEPVLAAWLQLGSPSLLRSAFRPPLASTCAEPSGLARLSRSTSAFRCGPDKFERRLHRRS
jgi:hypothetical protein